MVRTEIEGTKSTRGWNKEMDKQGRKGESERRRETMKRARNERRKEIKEEKNV